MGGDKNFTMVGTASHMPESLTSSSFGIKTNETNTPHQATKENVTTAPAACAEEDLIERFISIHTGLAELYPNIQPHERGAALFYELLRLCTAPYNEATCNAVLSDQRITRIIPDLRKYNAQGEGMLEEYWARRMLGSSSAGIEPSQLDYGGPLKSGFIDQCSILPQHSTTKIQEHDYAAAITLLKQYPPYQNYVDIARLELNAILSVSSPTDPARTWAFLGSGPIPLTSICLAQLLDPLPTPSGSPSATEQPPVQIHNIDRCPTAIALSSQLCQKLGRVTRCLTFECAEASGCTDLSTFDVVCLAALVGTETVEKFGIITSVAARMKPGALLVIRSAHGMRKMLCAVIEPAAMVLKDGSGVLPLVVVHPWNHVRNSVVVAKVVR